MRSPRHDQYEPKPDDDGRPLCEEAAYREVHHLQHRDEVRLLQLDLIELDGEPGEEWLSRKECFHIALPPSPTIGRISSAQLAESDAPPVQQPHPGINEQDEDSASKGQENRPRQDIGDPQRPAWPELPTHQ